MLRPRPALSPQHVRAHLHTTTTGMADDAESSEDDAGAAPPSADHGGEATMMDAEESFIQAFEGHQGACVPDP